MTQKTFNWGILGPGKIAKKFARGLSHVEGARLLSVASRSPERAQKFAEEFSVPRIFDSYEAMLADRELDIVYVATPHSFHYEHTLLSLRHKKAVLCEKPFALNKEQVKEMIATAQREKVFLMEAMWTQFLPHIKFVEELVNSGSYGKIRSLEADFGFTTKFDAEGRLYNKALGGGSLLDIGIYPLFLALTCLGKPKGITATACMSTTGIDEDCEVILQYPSNVKARLHSSIIRQTPTTAKIELEEAVLFINARFHEPSSIRISTPGGEETQLFEVDSNGYDFEARHVQDMLTSGRLESNQLSFSKSLALMELLDGVRKEIGLEY